MLSMFYSASVADAIVASEMQSSEPNDNIRIYNPIQSNIKDIGHVSFQTESLLLILQHLNIHKNRFVKSDMTKEYARWVLTKPPLFLSTFPTLDKMFYGVHNISDVRKNKKEYLEKHPIYKDFIFIEGNDSLIHVPVFLLQSKLSFAKIPNNNEDVYYNLKTTFNSIKKNVELFSLSDKDASASNKFIQHVCEIYALVLYINLFDIKTPSIRNLFFISKSSSNRQILQIHDDVLNKRNASLQLNGKNWIGHSLFVILYAHYYFDDLKSGLLFVQNNSQTKLIHSFLVGAIIGAKMGYNIFKDTYFKTQLDIVMNAPYRFSPLLHPSNFKDLLLKFKKSPGLYPVLKSIPNWNFLRTYLRKGYVPVSYRKEKDIFRAYFVFSESILVIVQGQEIKDMNTHKIQQIEVREKTSTNYKKSYTNILLYPQTKEINLLFRGKPAPIDEAYSFLISFSNALILRTLNEMDMNVDLTQINNSEVIEDYFHNKKFFLLN